MKYVLQHGYVLEGTVQEFQEFFNVRPQIEGLTVIAPTKMTNKTPTPRSKRGKGKHFTQEETLTLMLLYKEGFRPKQIARKMNTTPERIHNKIYSLRHNKMII